MDDLEALYASVSDFTDDLLDFSVAAAGAIGAGIVWGYVDEMLVSKIPVVGESNIARALVAVVAGVAGGKALAKTNKNLATGVAVGLTVRGITQLLRQFAPSLPLGGATTTIEQLRGASIEVEQVRALGGATTTVEQRAAMQRLGTLGRLGSTLTG